MKVKEGENNMSKGLESLKLLLDWFDDLHYGFDKIVKKSEEYKTIEKELKALEIIRNKCVDIHFVKISANYDHYVFLCDYGLGKQISKEEYDLLKEVLL
jgi:hypothetical protein